MSKAEANRKSGVYTTEYGNAAAWKKGWEAAIDIDMGEVIPLSMVDFTKWVGDIKNHVWHPEQLPTTLKLG